jgi:hypothetical protein
MVILDRMCGRGDNKCLHFLVVLFQIVVYVNR